MMTVIALICIAWGLHDLGEYYAGRVGQEVARAIQAPRPQPLPGPPGPRAIPGAIPAGLLPAAIVGVVWLAMAGVMMAGIWGWL